MQFVNGWKNPVFKLYNLNNDGSVITIELPITGSEGLLESTQELKLSQEFTDYSFLDQVYGYRITWTLPYSEYAHKDTMLKIQNIMRYRKLGYRIILIPRADVPQRRFEVIYTGDSLEYGIKKGGANAVGNRGVSIHWTTKNLVPDINWVDTDLTPIIVWSQPMIMIINS